MTTVTGAASVPSLLLQTTRFYNRTLFYIFTILFLQSNQLDAFFLHTPSQPQPSPLYLHNSARDISALQDWASKEGVIEENGFSLIQGENDDWSVQASEPIQAETRLLVIPRDLIWSSSRIQQELKENQHLETALELLQAQCPLQVPQFFLVLQLLRELEKGSSSRWYPWIQSLPKVFPTAVFMDELELECLPPLAWSLAKLERMHCRLFCETLRKLDSLLSEKTLRDTQLLRWAFNAVFTRCWAPPNNPNNTTTMHMVPLADMFNHAEPANVVTFYDPHGNCNVFSKTAIDQPNTPLTLSYGHSTNPSRFLTVFGFCDTNQPFIHCQILLDHPTQRHEELGYSTEQMVFNTKDGSIAHAVWKVLLYSILEQAPALQEAYYQACSYNDTTTAEGFEKQYRMETGIVIKKHVDKTIAELQALLDRIDREDFEEHPRLPLIQKQNQFLLESFRKVKQALDSQLQVELERRKQLQISSG